jgi:hypothetical protein
MGKRKAERIGRLRHKDADAPRKRGYMVLYHSTTPEAALGILRDGFKIPRSGRGWVGMEAPWEGVWVSTTPLDFNEGCKGDTVLRLRASLAADALREYEIIEEGKPYREWCVPANLLNCFCVVRVADWGVISLRESGLSRRVESQMAAKARRATGPSV